MKLFVALSLFSFAAAQLRPWPSWLPRFPGGTPKFPPWIDLHIVPGPKYNGITDAATNFHIGQSCSVQYEKHVYKGTCQRDDDFSKSAFGGCPEDVSLYGCGAERTSNLRSCLQSFSPFRSDPLADKIMNDRGRPQLNAVLCQSALWKILWEE